MHTLRAVLGKCGASGRELHRRCAGLSLEAALALKWCCAQGSAIGRAHAAKLRDFMGARMDRNAFLDDLQQKISAVIANTPAADIERNVKALVAQGLARFELVTREEFEVQRELVARLSAQAQALEARLAALEEGPRSTDRAA
jgi:ubiquinone biosynthesis accessory factor UbiK